MKTIKKALVTICLAFIGCTGVTQQNSYDIKFSHQIEKEMADEVIRPSRAGMLYSFIGDYHISNLYTDIPVSWGVDSINLQEYTTEEAFSYIIDSAKSHSIVLISENHLKPQHRIFASRIITELAEHGFKHLGLETFSSISNSNALLDSALISRGYPLNSPLTGTYTLEPKMGNLVRSAIKSNFKLFAYERSERIKGKDRDEIQADNVIRYLKSNPNSKLILVCGFHHAIESDKSKRGTSYWLAKYLKMKLGVDPLTIYQDNFTEKFIEDEHPILSSLDISEPSVLVDKSGGLLKVSKHVDFEIIHPKTTYVNGRPNWLYETKEHRSVKIELEKNEINFPIIVSAYPIQEINSVPVDRIELKHKYDNRVLVLEPGEYRIVIYDGEESITYTQIVK